MAAPIWLLVYVRFCFSCTTLMPVPVSVNQYLWYHWSSCDNNIDFCGPTFEASWVNRAYTQSSRWSLVFPEAVMGSNGVFKSSFQWGCIKMLTGCSAWKSLGGSRERHGPWRRCNSVLNRRILIISNLKVSVSIFLVVLYIFFNNVFRILF